jgi:hypothetical protein
LQNTFTSSVILVLLILVPISLQAQTSGQGDIVQLTVEGSSQNQDSALARAESLKDAINKGAQQIIVGLIGEASFEKNLNIIRLKVFPQSSKYVQYYKSSEPVKREADTITSVNLKISVLSLKDILAASGLLFKSEGLGTILPLFQVVEKKDSEKHFRWWREEATSQNLFVREQNISVIRQLEIIFRSQNFYLIDPVSQHYVQWLPDSFRSEKPSLGDLSFIGGFFKAQMILQGEVSIESMNDTPGGIRLLVKLNAVNAASGRIVGEVTRSFESSSSDWSLGVSQLIKKSMSDVAKDLVLQVSDEWTKGTFGATLLQLSLRGNMNYQDYESFKKQILSKLSEVKSIRERKIERGSSTFEVDAGGGVTALSKRLSTINFEGFKLSVERIDSERVNLRWTKVALK